MREPQLSHHPMREHKLSVMFAAERNPQMPLSKTASLATAPRYFHVELMVDAVPVTCERNKSSGVQHSDFSPETAKLPF